MFKIKQGIVRELDLQVRGSPCLLLKFEVSGSMCHDAFLILVIRCY